MVVGGGMVPQRVTLPTIVVRDDNVNEVPKSTNTKLTKLPLKVEESPKLVKDTFVLRRI